jgi:hypothetical protein
VANFDERDDDKPSDVDSESWEEVADVIPVRTWEEEVAEADLPPGCGLLTTWKRARDALLTAGGLSPGHAAALGAALRAEFDRHQQAGGSWLSGIYQDLQQLEEVAGQVRGRFYVDWSSVLDEYRAARRDEDALQLLLDLIAAAERVAQVDGGPPAPAYTERAAVIYRRRRDYGAEIAILERWEKAAVDKATRGSAQAALAQRLEVARKLQHRSARQAGTSGT